VSSHDLERRNAVAKLHGPVAEPSGSARLRDVVGFIAAFGRGAVILVVLGFGLAIGAVIVLIRMK
jgi:hypothetical protein